MCSKVAVMVFIVWGWLREREVMQRWMLIECFLALTHTHIHVERHMHGATFQVVFSSGAR